ncbi:MAG TPA: phage Gp37/Gp68 family protein [Candidatus Acidoferrales bacterium]|nr:phage Gp37/Gp68 family protein [Candidatus Acidoferrales bacterium]
MSGRTGIEWTDATWNTVTGCTKVSPGCAHCYAERITERFHGPGSFEKVILHPEKLDEPLHWRKPRRVFVNSMSDLFHEDVPDEFIDRVFAAMALASQHTYQVLTKRPDRMLSYFGRSLDERLVRDALVEGTAQNIYAERNPLETDCSLWLAVHLPLRNIWLGVSVENQRFADERIPLLLRTPAAVKFISAEPLLGPVCLTDVKEQIVPEMKGDNHIHINSLRCIVPSHIDWVIVGGESGPSARPMQLEWARSLRDQCKATRTAFFMKQLGGVHDKRGNLEDFPVDLRIREFPKRGETGERRMEAARKSGMRL